jgi:hypothetical protein
MSAIITDQIRILNAKNFVLSATSESNSYYTFVGLPNAESYDSNWNNNPPPPKDCFEQENDYWDTMIGLKKINSGDVKLVVRKNMWESGTIYDMYRHDISRDNPSKPSGSINLYSANYYTVNSNYQVYICLHNGIDPDNPTGRLSLDEPTFTDLEPRSAGNSGDGYIWKYLYTLNSGDVIKFDLLNYVPVPIDWDTNPLYYAIKNNAQNSGQIKIATIKNRGQNVGSGAGVYNRVPIYGDGIGAEATIVINNQSEIESVTITNGGSGYTYGTLDLIYGNVPVDTSSIYPEFDVIIPPKGGHGYDVARELGAYNVMIYSRIMNDNENPDFITGNQFARIGIVENPLSYDSNSLLSPSLASAVSAIKVGAGYSTVNFTADSEITQTIGTGVTAIGKVISYDQNTGVLKYWQDKSLVGFSSTGIPNNPLNPPRYGFNMNRFTSSPLGSGNLVIIGGTFNVSIDSSFNGASTTIINKTYNLGQTFINGLANPEVEKYSGSIIYVDNRPPITRSTNQKEDIKVILQF